MDVAALQSAVSSRLPQHARWLMGDGTPLDFSFYTAPRTLADLLAAEGCDGVVAGGEDFLAFGEYDVAEGGGARPWIVVSATDAGVFTIDVESEVPKVLLNSSLHAFIETFRLLHKYLGAGQPLPADIGALVEELDPEAYPSSEWRGWVDYLTAA